MFTYRLVPGLPNYRVGSDGSVWSRARLGRPAKSARSEDGWRRLKPTYFKKHNRLVVSLGRGKPAYPVGRLVLETFVGPCPRGLECCHFPDRDGRNCSLANLRWDTSAANTNDQRYHRTLVGGEHHGMARFTNAQIEEIRSLAGTLRQREIAAKFCISQGYVSELINERRRTVASVARQGLVDAAGPRGKFHPSAMIASGERNGNARLSAVDVVDIRRRLAAGERQRHIAGIFSVSQATIGCIARRKTWTQHG